MKSAAPFLTVEIDPDKWVAPHAEVGVPFDSPFLALQSALIVFSCAPRRRPYTSKTRVRTIRRAIDAFAELRDALGSLDFETQRHIAGLHDSLSPESRRLLGEFESRLDYHDFTQRYWRECRGWIEGLGLLLEKLPAPEVASNSKRPRDLLIEHLHNLFAEHGKPRRGVKNAKQEQRFVNTILKAMGTEPMDDPARRLRALRPKKGD